MLEVVAVLSFVRFYIPLATIRPMTCGNIRYMYLIFVKRAFYNPPTVNFKGVSDDPLCKPNILLSQLAY